MTNTDTPACTAADENLTVVESVMLAGRNAYATYVGNSTCTVGDPTAADILESHFKVLLAVLEQTACARRSADAAVRSKGEQDFQTIQQLRNQLSLAIVHMRLQTASQTANDALDAAKKAKNIDDAKAAAKTAAAQAQLAHDQLALQSDDCAQRIAATVRTTDEAVQHQVDLRDGANESMCGADDLGLPKSSCGIYGVSAAALSYLWAFSGSGVDEGRQLASVGVPAAAYRAVLNNWVALDVGGYSAFISKSLASATPSADRVACSKSPTDYENRLPCEASNQMYPYFGAYLGFTMGRKGVGFLTVTPITAGIAQLGTRATLMPYFGLSIGALQLNGSF